MNSDEKYWNIVNRLRNSKPVMDDPCRIRENVLKEVRRLKKNGSKGGTVEEILFGWIYIGWIRKSLITAATAVVLIFAYQQVLILRKINSLSTQRYTTTNETAKSIADDISTRIVFYRIAGKRFPDQELNVSEREIDKLVLEIKKLKVKYEDLIFMIENDSRLNEYFDEKLNNDISSDNFFK